VEQVSAQEWDAFTESAPNIRYPRASYAVNMRRSMLALALHADAEHGAIAAGFDRGISAYCWPRNALWVGSTFEQLGQPEIGRHVFRWLANTKGLRGPYSYWFQKYTIDGYPEWETPAVDPTALVPWRIEQHYQRTGDREFVAASWGLVEQAAAVCGGASGHPGLRWLDDLSVVTSAGVWDHRFGAFLYSNVCVVAGLRSASRLANLLGNDALATTWTALADRVWNEGILQEPRADRKGPGMIDPESGRFFEARRLSMLRGLWTDRPEQLLESSSAIDASLLGPVVPFGLLPATNPIMRRCAEALFEFNRHSRERNLLTAWTGDPKRRSVETAPSEALALDISSLASLWMARYLLQLGRETGEARHWTLALTMLDGILSHLGALNLALRPQPRPGDAMSIGLGPGSGAWELHANLVETLLDFSALEYNAADKRLTLAPVLPSSWPSIGRTDKLPCGEVCFRLDRPLGSNTYRLRVETALHHDVTASIDLTCPGLVELGPFVATVEGPPPAHERGTGRLRWSATLPEGRSAREWTWG
jgi:GH15 family glucan-1,4-alpha-glucosidase